MSETTSTRKTLRRAIARAARLEFFRRYSANEVALTGTPTASLLYSTSLTQSDDHWNGGWVYFVDGTYLGQERRITDFAATGDVLTMEYALAGAPAAGVMIEIFDTWSAADIHDAINRSIREWGRLFFESVIDQTLVMKEDTMEYTISGLTKKPWIIKNVRVERAGNSIQSVVDSATVVTTNVHLVDASVFKTDDQYNGYKISIYDGTGAGQLGDVVDTIAAGTYIQVATSQFTVTPDSTSKFRLWQPTEQLVDSWPLRNYRTDAQEFPDTLFLNKLEPEFYGMRFFISYLSQPSELTTDASTTIVPMDFIINQSLAYLHESLMNDNRSDANRHANIAEVYSRKALEYRSSFAPRQPATMLQLEENTGYSDSIEDPLGWRS